MKKFLMLTLCAGILTPAAFAQTPAPPSNPPPARLEMRDVKPFPDVPPDHWAAKAVETLHRAGIVQGYPPTVKATPKSRQSTAKRQTKTAKG